MPKLRRTTVNLDESSVAIIEKIMQREGVNLTEAMRRAIGYGGFVYDAIKVDRGTVLVKKSDGETHELVIL